MGEGSSDVEGSIEGFEMWAETAGLVTMLESASDMVSRRSGIGGLGRGHVFCGCGFESSESSCDVDCSLMLGVREFSLLAMCSEGSLDGGGVGIAAWVDTSEGGISCGRSGGGSQKWSSRLASAAGEVEDESSCDLCSGRAIVLVSWGVWVGKVRAPKTRWEQGKRKNHEPEQSNCD